MLTRCQATLTLSLSLKTRDRDRDIQTPTVSAGEAATLTETQRSKRLTDAYAEAVPMCKWAAVNGVVLSAIKSGKFSDDEIRAALLRLAADNRPVTIDSLRTELVGIAPLSQRTRTATAPTAAVAHPTTCPARTTAKEDPRYDPRRDQRRKPPRSGWPNGANASSANLLANRPAEFAAPGDVATPTLADWAARPRRRRQGQNLILPGPWAPARRGPSGRPPSRPSAAATRASWSSPPLRRPAAASSPPPPPTRASSRAAATAGLLAIDDLGAFGCPSGTWITSASLPTPAGPRSSRPWSRPTRPTCKSLLGPRISSRLSHNALIVPMDGPDRRRQP